MRNIMTGHKFTTVTVQLEDRPGDGVRVYSQQLPGLILSGADKESILKQIVPTIERLLAHIGLTNIVIHPSRPLTSVMNGDNPQEWDVHVQEFVVEYDQAA